MRRLRNIWGQRWTVLAIAGIFLLSACAGIKPYEPTAAGEIPPGPGLLSGKDGEFTIFRK